MTYPCPYHWPIPPAKGTFCANSLLHLHQGPRFGLLSQISLSLSRSLSAHAHAHAHRPIVVTPSRLHPPANCRLCPCFCCALRACRCCPCSAQLSPAPVQISSAQQTARLPTIAIMRSLEDARTSWQELHQYKTLRQLKDAVRLSPDGHSSVATRGLRSACWKAFLLFDTLDLDEWQRVLASSRSAYNSLHAHFFRSVEDRDAETAGLDPLSQDTEV